MTPHKIIIMPFDILPGPLDILWGPFEDASLARKGKCDFQELNPCENSCHFCQLRIASNKVITESHLMCLLYIWKCQTFWWFPRFHASREHVVEFKGGRTASELAPRLYQTDTLKKQPKLKPDIIKCPGARAVLEVEATLQSELQ